MYIVGRMLCVSFTLWLMRPSYQLYTPGDDSWSITKYKIMTVIMINIIIRNFYTHYYESTNLILPNPSLKIRVHFCCVM